MSLSYPEWRSVTLNLPVALKKIFLFAYLTGTYTNSDESRTFVIDDTIFFNFDTNTHSFLLTGNKQLVDILKEKRLLK